MPKPILGPNGRPLIRNGKPAIADDPCVCCGGVFESCTECLAAMQGVLVTISGGVDLTGCSDCFGTYRYSIFNGTYSLMNEVFTDPAGGSQGFGERDFDLIWSGTPDCEFTDFEFDHCPDTGANTEIYDSFTGLHVRVSCSSVISYRMWILGHTWTKGVSVPICVDNQPTIGSTAWPLNTGNSDSWQNGCNNGTALIENQNWGSPFIGLGCSPSPTIPITIAYEPIF